MCLCFVVDVKIVSFVYIFIYCWMSSYWRKMSIIYWFVPLSWFSPICICCLVLKLIWRSIDVECDYYWVLGNWRWWNFLCSLNWLFGIVIFNSPNLVVICACKSSAAKRLEGIDPSFLFCCFCFCICRCVEYYTICWKPWEKKKGWESNKIVTLITLVPFPWSELGRGMIGLERCYFCWNEFWGVDMLFSKRACIAVINQKICKRQFCCSAWIEGLKFTSLWLGV